MSRQALSKAPLREVENIRQLLSNEAAIGQIEMVAAGGLDARRMARVIAAASRQTPKLQQCEPMSFLGALMAAASLGLEPNTPLGHAYILPFDVRGKVNGKWQVTRTDAQLIIGYKGYMQLARRSGLIRSLHADVVYDDDELFDYEYGTDMRLKHRPGTREGVKTHAYCHFHLQGDGEGFAVMNRNQIEKIRNNSQGYRAAIRAAEQYSKTPDTPWVTNEDEMWCKTPVRAIAQHGELPMSTDFARALSVDDARRDYASFATAIDVGHDDLPDAIEDHSEPQDVPYEVQGGSKGKASTAKAQPEPEPEAADTDAQPEMPGVSTQNPEMLNLPPWIDDEGLFTADGFETWLFQQVRPMIESLPAAGKRRRASGIMDAIATVDADHPDWGDRVLEDWRVTVKEWFDA